VLDVAQVLDGGMGRIQMRALNQDGKVVCEGLATIRPIAPLDWGAARSDDLAWLKGWARDVTASIPAKVYDFTDPTSPREQTLSKPITEDIVRATRALFGGLDSDHLAPLVALGTMAMASAESAPGHLLLSAKLIEIGEPIRGGDRLTLKATVPPPDQIKRSQKGKGQPIVPVAIEVRDQRGELLLRGQVVKLME
jgi:hypothetical protein